MKGEGKKKPTLYFSCYFGDLKYPRYIANYKPSINLVHWPLSKLK